MLRIATRRSPLAQWQARHVGELLRSAHPGLETELVTRDTAADQDLSRPIAEIGGKGAFSKEIQDLVLSGAADLAVHSAKDLQATTPDGLVIAAVPPRGTIHDCLVGARLDDLPAGAVVGTGSARRRALLLDLRPDLKVDGLRGNIATRLGRLDDLDAIVMAAVALERLGERSHVIDDLDPGRFVPQVGQGALAVECRTADQATIDLVAVIDHERSRLELDVERAFLRRLGGDCDLHAGAHATLSVDGLVTVRGVLASGPEGERLARAELTGDPGEAPGQKLAERLLGSDPTPAVGN